MLLLPTNRATRRVDIPHEPGQWVEITRLAWSEMPTFQLRATDLHAYIAALFAKAVTGWSYDVPPTPENLAYLDDTTAGWLYIEIDKFLHHAETDPGNATTPSGAS